MSESVETILENRIAQLEQFIIDNELPVPPIPDNPPPDDDDDDVNPG